MKYRNRKRNKNVIITLILISLLIIGYSLISTNFNIGGVLKLEKIKSDVHFGESILYDNDNTDSSEIILDEQKTTASLSISMETPGDKYGFCIDIINEGEIDSMLDEINFEGLTEEQQKYIKISYKYMDGVIPSSKDLLASGESESLIVNILYSIDEIENNEELESIGGKIELNLNISYVQADETANERGTGLYNYLLAKATRDDISSTYVTSAKGIDFTKVSSDTNGKGLYKTGKTNNKILPDIYYRGEVEDNNLLFNNTCWKIIRSTELGGIKLIYNGLPDDNDHCNSTGSNTIIGNSTFNSVANSLTNIGYMTGTEYINKEKKMLTEVQFVDSIEYNDDYLFSASFTYDSSNETYTLSTPNPLNTTTKDDLIGNYVVSSTTNNPNSSMFYVGGYEDNTLYGVKMVGVSTMEEANTEFVIGNDRGWPWNNENNNDNYFLEGAHTTNKIDWINNYESYEYDYFFENNQTESSTNDFYEIIATTMSGYEYCKVSEKLYYNNDYEYDSENNTISFTGYGSYTSNYHYYSPIAYPYLMFVDSPEDEGINDFENTNKINFVYYSDNKYIYYIELENGTKYYDVYNSTINNTNNSTIKNIIENWYNSNMLDKTEKLEDAIYCNDRSVTERKNGWMTSERDTDNRLEYLANKRIVKNKEYSNKCKNKNDSFTVSSLNGNGKNIYPIGLLTADEMIQAGLAIGTANSTNYLNNGVDYWTMTPYGIGNINVFTFYINSNGELTDDKVDSSYGVRPVITLKNSSKYLDGDGTINNPYKIK